jgi:hypothetical protein
MMSAGTIAVDVVWTGGITPTPPIMDASVTVEMGAALLTTHSPAS